MPISAGLLMYRPRDDRLEVLLVHPGGPFWKNKDVGAWTIPKGLVGEGEDLLAAAKREFQEETGHAASGAFLPLPIVRLKSGKIVHAWAVQGDLDPEKIQSNTFTIEWPPRSGRKLEVPEIDRAAFFALAQARQKILSAQLPLLDALESLHNV